MNPAMAAPNDIAHDSEVDAAADAGAHALPSESDHSRVVRISTSGGTQSVVCRPSLGANALQRLRAERVSFRFASNTLEDLVEHPG